MTPSILSRAGVTVDRILDWMIGFIDTLYTHNPGLQAIQLIYTLYSPLSHTHYSSQSSLVASWQRIYNSLTATSNHT
jgi:hypothetical protein